MEEGPSGSRVVDSTDELGGLAALLDRGQGAVPSEEGNLLEKRAVETAGVDEEACVEGVDLLPGGRLPRDAETNRATVARTLHREAAGLLEEADAVLEAEILQALDEPPHVDVPQGIASEAHPLVAVPGPDLEDATLLEELGRRRLREGGGGEHPGRDRIDPTGARAAAAAFIEDGHSETLAGEMIGSCGPGASGPHHHDIEIHTAHETNLQIARQRHI